MLNDLVRNHVLPAIVVLNPITYAGGYFATSDTHPTRIDWGFGRLTPTGGLSRVFDSRRLAELYRPMTWIESRVRSKHVGAYYSGYVFKDRARFGDEKAVYRLPSRR